MMRQGKAVRGSGRIGYPFILSVREERKARDRSIAANRRRSYRFVAAGAGPRLPRSSAVDDSV